jgi:hypothetical protein
MSGIVSPLSDHRHIWSITAVPKKCPDTAITITLWAAGNALKAGLIAGDDDLPRCTQNQMPAADALRTRIEGPS